MDANQLIDEIASAVLARTRIPLDIDLWDTETIANYLKRSVRQVSERIVCLPTFPRAIRIPSGGPGRSQPLWKATEVIAWAEKHQDRKAA